MNNDTKSKFHMFNKNHPPSFEQLSIKLIWSIYSWNVSVIMNSPATKLYKRGKSVVERHLWAARVVCIADAPSLCCHIYCSTNRPGLKHVTCTNYIRLLDLNNDITNAFILGRKEWKDKDGYLWIPWAVHCNKFFFFIQALLGQNEIQFNFLILLSFLKFIFCKGFEIYRSWANFVHVQPYANSLILENDTFNATCLLYVYVISAHSWLTSTKYLNKTFLYC